MKHYIATAALIAAGTAFADAADLIWSQTNIGLTGSNTYTIDKTINDGFTVKIDLSDWQVANGPIGWLTTTAGNDYENSAATFGWGATANGATGHATTFTKTNGSASGQQAGTRYEEVNSYGASASTAFDTVLFLTVSGGTASLYEQTEVGNEVVLVAQTTGMSTSAINGLYVGHWEGRDSQQRGGTMDVGIYKGVLTTTDMASMIPEPSAFGLLAGLGALALVASRRRRK